MFFSRLIIKERVSSPSCLVVNDLKLFRSKLASVCGAEL